MSKINVALLFLGDSMYPQETIIANMTEIDGFVSGIDGIDLLVSEKIMNEKDAVSVSKKMDAKKFDLIMTCFVSWHITPFVMKVLNDYTSVPILVWGVGGKTNRSGCLHSPAAAAGVTALVPVLKEFGFTYEVVQEKADEPHRFEDIESFVRVVGAAKKIRSSRIGLVGYADMGLYSCSYDRTAIFKKIGVDIEDYIGFEITELMAKFPAADVDLVIEDIKKSMSFQNSISYQSLERVARLYLALKLKADTRELDAVSIKCVFGTAPILGFSPCLAQTLLANKDLSVICECDAYGLITNLILNSITGKTSAFMEHYEVVDNGILVGVCGFIPRDFVEGDVKIRSSNLGDSLAGVANVSKVKTGQVTFGRFFEEQGAFKLFLTRAEAVEPPKWTELGWDEPTPDFPSLLLKLEMPVDRYIEKVPGQHIVMAFGDHVNDIKKLCKLLGVEVVE